jgi:hypothetical protein
VNLEGYAPFFSKIVLSSLWKEPDYVVKVFLTMLAIKDTNHLVKLSAYNISQLAHKTEKETLDALAILAAPDTRRIEPQPFDGRRIEKTPTGWLILNGKFYQDLMAEVNRRSYSRRWMANKRAKARSGREADGVSGGVVGDPFYEPPADLAEPPVLPSETPEGPGEAQMKRPEYREAPATAVPVPEPPVAPSNGAVDAPAVEPERNQCVVPPAAPPAKRAPWIRTEGQS